MRRVALPRARLASRAFLKSNQLDSRSTCCRRIALKGSLRLPFRYLRTLPTKLLNGIDAPTGAKIPEVETMKANRFDMKVCYVQLQILGEKSGKEKV